MTDEYYFETRNRLTELLVANRRAKVAAFSQMLTEEEYAVLRPMFTAVEEKIEDIQAHLESHHGASQAES